MTRRNAAQRKNERGSEKLFGHYLTSFIRHNENGGGWSQSLGIEHLYWDQVLRVRIQVVYLVVLQGKEEEGEWKDHDDDYDKKNKRRELAKNWLAQIARVIKLGCFYFFYLSGNRQTDR